MKRLLFCFFVAAFSFSASAQKVAFPQQQQPGTAVVSDDGGVFTLSNDLFSASFRESGGTLLFDGCAEMGLNAGTELFSITLGSGTVVNASQMTLGSVTTENLSADATAAKGALHYAGKAIRATFTYGNLSLTWRAVLRDGSHYLRTELKVDASADVAFTSLTPMQYVVDNSTSATAPAVVGNTRGAVIASDKIFAGLETPMGIVSAGGGLSTEPFAYSAWAGSYFSWEPGSETPAGITNLGLPSTYVSGAKGYLALLSAGTQTVTFQYTSGSHRLDICGVDIIDPTTGNVVASDYHKGYTGGSKSNNVYTLSVPAAGYYLVRYFRDKTEEVNGTITGSFNSNGTITWSCDVIAPYLAYDGNTSANVLPSSGGGGGGSYSYPTLAVGGTRTDAWTPSSWSVTANVPQAITDKGFYNPNVLQYDKTVSFDEAGGTFSADFQYQSGNHRLNMVGVALIDGNDNVVASDYHVGYSGGNKVDNVYSFVVPATGDYIIRYYIENKTESVDASGNINLSYNLVYTYHLASPTETPIQGVWSRETTLASGKSWEVGSVVGLIAPGQARRSFLAYSERERAVPWRAFPMYNSWYELNIDRNNDADYSSNFTEAQCAEVLSQWKTHLFDAYGVGIGSFVWDDGWDIYGTWEFNSHFPNGFSNLSDQAWAMNSQIGAWLGPVGGYGTSGTYRRNYWSSLGGMQLSNPAYYNVFLTRTTYMLQNYHFNFFKFDGISAQYSAVGPDAGSTGQENAEAIIDIEKKLREVKPDVFLNTTVGTWASPFWFQVTDAVWRQESDWGTIGNQGNTRERWITFRDQLVYKNFVQNSPLCPINTLMTHGFMLSEYGGGVANMSRNYDDIVREMRCAFACGSGMVEIYADFSLMNSINNGALWKDLADCIKWQKAQEDVLPDIHWVGGNPWDGSKANVYGWAAWNGINSVLTLRNPSASAQSYTFTLREALDIPSYVSGSITFSKAFSQDDLSGFTVGTAYDIDASITVNMPASSVFIFNGGEQGETPVEVQVTWQITEQNGTVRRTYNATYEENESVSTYPAGLTSGLQDMYVTLPAFDTFQATDGLTKSVVYGTNLPFTVSTAETPTWYAVKIGGRYLVGKDASDGNASLSRFRGAVDKMCWSFYGNPWDGFLIRPASDLDGNLLVSSSAEGTQPIMGTTDYLWKIERVDENQFSIRATDATQYLNRHGAYDTRVALWRSGGTSDNNSKCLVEAVDLSRNLTAGYYRIRNKHYSTRYISAVNGKINTYVSEGEMSDADMANTIVRLESQPDGSFRLSQLKNYMQNVTSYNAAPNSTTDPTLAFGTYFVYLGDGYYTFSVCDSDSDPYANFNSSNLCRWTAGETDNASRWQLEAVENYELSLNVLENKGYSTAYLPFGIVMPSDGKTKVYVVSADFAEGRADSQELLSAAAPLCTPVLIISEGTEAAVTLTVADSDTSADAASLSSNQLQGTFVALDSNGQYVFSGNNRPIGFYKISAATQLKPYKAYIDAPASGYNVPALVLGEGNTGIDVITKTSGNPVFYDLQGRRTTTPVRGLYIRDKQKILIR